MTHKLFLAAIRKTAAEEVVQAAWSKNSICVLQILTTLSSILHLIRTLHPKKIIVSNKSLGLSRLSQSWDLGQVSFYMHNSNKFLELSNVVPNNFIDFLNNVEMKRPLIQRIGRKCGL